jgi:hypothetical protein
MTIPTTPFATTSQDYDAAIKWMELIGIKLSTGRMKKYKQVIEYWTDAYKNASDTEAKARFPDFFNSIFEIYNFIEIHQAFKLKPISELDGIIKKLQKGVYGPTHSVDEKLNSSAARNYIFEALIAALLHCPQNGMEAILDSESDTGVHIQNKKVWVECKRITTIERINENVRKASEQLETILQKSSNPNHRGLVAIDITKIINPDDKIYIRKNDAELKSSLHELIKGFEMENSSLWERIYERRHKNVIGTIIYFSLMASSEERGLLVRTTQLAINPRTGIHAADKSLLESIVQAIETIG